jgi:hypothetical protein
MEILQSNSGFTLGDILSLFDDFSQVTEAEYAELLGLYERHAKARAYPYVMNDNMRNTGAAHHHSGVTTYDGDRNTRSVGHGGRQWVKHEGSE